MPSSLIVIIAVAVVGGVLVVSLISGLIIFLTCRRRKKRRRRNEEMDNMRLSRQTGSNVDLSQVATYSPTRLPGGSGRLTGFKKGKSVSFPGAGRSQDEVSSLSSTRSRLKEKRTGRARRGTDPPASVASLHTEAERAAISETLGVYLPSGVPTKEPLTPISERDTPDSGRGVIRQGYHLPGKPHGWRYISRSDDSRSPGCFESPAPKRPDGRADGSKTGIAPKPASKRSILLRSLSFQGGSVAAGPTSSSELPPTPDAIYDACSRLSPFPSKRSSVPRHVRTGSESDALTRSSMSSVFDANASFTTAASYFASVGRPSGRESKREAHPADTVHADPTKRYNPQRSSTRSPLIFDGDSQTVKDSLQVTRHPSTLMREKSSSMSLSLYDNWQQTPVKRGQDAAERSHREQHIDSWHSTHPSERHSEQHIRSLHSRTPSDTQPPARGRSRRQVLQESANSSNRQSSATSPSSSSAAPSKNKHAKKKSRDDSRPKKHRANGQQSHKRSSTHRIFLQISRPNSVATSAILEDETFTGSSSRRSKVLSDADSSAPVDFRPSSKGRFAQHQLAGRFLDTDDDLTSSTRPLAGSFVDQDPDQYPSTVQSAGRSGDSSISAMRKYDGLANPASGEDSEDLLRLPFEQPESSEGGSDIQRRLDTIRNEHMRPYQPPSPPTTVDEMLDLKPIPPLRPRSSALSINVANPANRISVISASPSHSTVEAGDEVAVPQPLRPRSSAHLKDSRTMHPLRQARSTTKSQRDASQDGLHVRASREHLLLPMRSTPPPPLSLRQSLRLNHSPQPPTEPPPPPPPVPSRHHARMTSMVMQLRRENSDSSRAGSTYFRLPQSQRTSRGSYGLTTQANSNVSSARASRAYGQYTGLPTEQEASQQINLGRTISLSSVSASSLLARRAAAAVAAENGRENDPFVDKKAATGRGSKADPTEIRPRSSRQLPPTPMYLPGYEPPQSPSSYEPFKPAPPQSQSRPGTSNSSSVKAAGPGSFGLGLGLAVQREREREREKEREYERQRQMGHGRQQLLTGYAIDAASAAEPILVVERDQTPEKYRRAPLDDSERDLSPIGKKIMAEKRTEHFDRQRAPGSVPSGSRMSGGSSVSGSGSLAASGSIRQGGNRVHNKTHRRNKSSLGSGFAPSIGEDSETLQSRRSRRESQRQRVSDLRERVASMEFARKDTKTT